jgi:hypothetical protein
MSETWYRGEAVEARKEPGLRTDAAKGVRYDLLQKPCSLMRAAAIIEVVTTAGFVLVLNKLAVAAAPEIAALPGRRSCLSDC